MLQPPERRSNSEYMGQVRGYDVLYDRVNGSYEITGPGVSMTVRGQDVSNFALLLGDVERDSDRRHFTGDDGPVREGMDPTGGDEPDDDEPDEPDGLTGDEGDGFDPDDVADLVAHDMAAHAAVFGPGVQVFRI